MAFETPTDTINRLLAARSSMDVDAALDCYETNASVVMEPGHVARGLDSIRAFTQATLSLPITFGARMVIEGDAIALHISEWIIRPVGGAEISGRTADVLRRQSDGRWLLMIDNPWGTALLDATEKI